MSWVYVGVAGATLVGGAISSNGSKSAASKAADTNSRNVADTNALNRELFYQGRGSPGTDGYGHAILPNYFGGNEEALGQQAYDNFNRLNNAGLDSYNRSLGYQNQFRPSINAGINAVNNRFNGQDLQQRVGFANPYFTSRLNQANVYGQGLHGIADANSSAINTGLSQVLAQQNAQRARQGFFGNSTFDRNRALSSTIAARQAAAIEQARASAGANDAYAGAQLGNAGDLRGLQMSDLDFRSRLDFLPASMGALSSYENGPNQALAQSYSTAMTPLNYFRIAPQAYQNQNQPMQEPMINNGQIIGGAISQGANSFAQYQYNQQLQRMYGMQQPSQGPQNPYTMASSYNPYAVGAPAQYGALQGASAFSNPYAPQANTMPTFNTAYQPTQLGLTPGR